MSDETDEGVENEEGEVFPAEVQSSEAKIKRKRKSPNYVLQLCLEAKDEDTEAWVDLQSGFVSPEKAFDHMQVLHRSGRYRTVRVVGPVYEAKLIEQEPILVVRKVK